MSRPEDAGGHEQAALDAYGGARSYEGDRSTEDDTKRRAPLTARYGRREPQTPIEHGDAPSAEPDRALHQCQNCGADVSARERRLFGDNANVLWHCRRCLDERSALQVGAGARPDWDPDGFASKQYFSTGGDR